MTTQLEQDVALAAECGFEKLVYHDLIGAAAKARFHRFANAIREQAGPQWISVEDRLPSEDEEVIAFSEEYGMFVTTIKTKDYDFLDSVTHWMLRPTTPIE